MGIEQLDDKAIFNIARRIEDQEARAQYLDQVCSNRQTRDQINALLSAHVKDKCILDDALPAAVATIDMPPVEEKPGTQIGPYKLLQQIGEGGFGVVYMAEQHKPVRRKVALKIIKPGMDTKEVIARFEAERQALALMDHPNIAKVLDAGATESGRPYFVMELVKGVPITEFCDEQKLSTPDRLQLFVDICRAIQHAHQKGIIHRDLKPSNIMVTLDDNRPIPKVIDFGISKALSQQLTEKTLFTAYGQMIGTPLYMAPEQAQMNMRDVDTRSDVYSLGVLLYELLTGTTPFDKETLQKSGFEEMRRIICEVEPPRPSARVSTLQAEAFSTVSNKRKIDARKLSQSLRGELDWIVMKALEKDRIRRYESASAFAADVERYLNDEPVQACPPSVWYRLGKFTRRHMWQVAASTIFASTVLAALIGQLISLSIVNQRNVELLEERQLKDRAQQDRIAALQESAQAQQEKAKALEREAATARHRKLALAHFQWREGNVEEADQLLETISSNNRRWAWHYLKRLCNSELSRFAVGRAAAHQGVFSGDGSRFAGTIDQSKPTEKVAFWDVATGRRMASLSGKLLALNHRGDVAVIRAKDGIQLQGVANGRIIWRISEVIGGIQRVAFSTSGDFLAASTQNEVQVWNWDTKKQIARIDASRIEHLGVSDEAEQIATTSGGQLTVWNIATRKPIQTIRGVRDSSPIVFGPTGKRLACVAKSHAVLVVDMETKKVQRLNGHDGIVLTLSFDPAGKLLATGGVDHKIFVWDIARGVQVRYLRGARHMVTGVAFDSTGKQLSSVDRSGMLKTWLHARDQVAQVIPVSVPWYGALSPHGNFCGIAALDGSVRIFDVASSGEEFSEFLKSDTPWSVTFSPDGKLMAVGGTAGTIYLYDVDARKRIGTLPKTGRDWPVSTVAFSPDGKRVAAGGQGRRVCVWDVKSGEKVFEVAGHVHSVTKVEFSRDGKHLVSASGGTVHATRGNGPDGMPLPRDGQRQPADIKIWDASTGTLLRTIGPLHEKTEGLSVSSDGKLIAATFNDGTVRLFGVATGQSVRTLQRHTSGAWVATFHPTDSRILVTGDRGGTLKVWDTKAGRAILIPGKHPINVGSIEFSSDGNRLITVGISEDIRVWDATPLKR